MRRRQCEKWVGFMLRMHWELRHPVMFWSGQSLKGITVPDRLKQWVFGSTVLKSRPLQADDLAFLRWHPSPKQSFWDSTPKKPDWAYVNGYRSSIKVFDLWQLRRFRRWSIFALEEAEAAASGVFSVTARTVGSGALGQCDQHLWNPKTRSDGNGYLLSGTLQFGAAATVFGYITRPAFFNLKLTYKAFRGRLVLWSIRRNLMKLSLNPFWPTLIIHNPWWKDIVVSTVLFHGLLCRPCSCSIFAQSIFCSFPLSFGSFLSFPISLSTNVYDLMLENLPSSLSIFIHLAPPSPLRPGLEIVDFVSTVCFLHLYRLSFSLHHFITAFAAVHTVPATRGKPVTLYYWSSLESSKKFSKIEKRKRNANISHSVPGNSCLFTFVFSLKAIHK